MKKTWIKRVLCLALAIVFAFGALSKSTSELKSEIAGLNSRISQISKEQTELKNKIASASAQISSLSAQLDYLTAEIDYIDEQIIVIDNLVAEYEQLIEEQSAEIASLETDIARQKSMIDDMIRMSYEYNGVGSAVEFIFGAENFSDMLTRLDMLAYHLTYNEKVLQNYSDSLDELVRVKADYEESVVQMNAFRDQQTALRAELVVKQNEAEAKRAQIQADQALYEQSLAEANAAKNEVLAEMDQISAMLKKQEEEERRRAAQNNTTPSIQTPSASGYIFPLPSGTWRLTSYYGYRADPFTGKTAYHNGYDLAAPKGTKIYAIADGKVMTATYNAGGFGNYVIISHGGGILSLYGHASSLNVKAGQNVKQGDVIAFVGSTGRSTGNHLHLTMYKDGKLVDPANYVNIPK